MKFLVTGAAGFLGQAVLTALRSEGHEAIAGVRAPRDGQKRVDVLDPATLPLALEGVDGVIHLAAQMVGPPAELTEVAVLGTENLVRAMAQAGVRRLVLASSFAVYDFDAAGDFITEDSPLVDPDRAGVDGYAAAKRGQEALATEQAAALGLDLVVLRPAAVFGPGRMHLPELGHFTKSLLILVDPDRPLRLSYLENCARAFAFVAGHPEAAGVFQVVDEPVSARRFADAFFGQNRVILPRALGLGLATVASAAAKYIPLLDAKLPGIARPVVFRSRFGRARASGDRLARLGFSAPCSFSDAVTRCAATSTEKPQ